jgi:hypothetical protein
MTTFSIYTSLIRRRLKRILLTRAELVADVFFAIVSRLDLRRPIRRPVSYDVIFAALTIIISGIVYLIPFLYYPGEQSNPWPYAYNVIQSQIISSGHFLNQVPQLGAFVPFDYGWFTTHHLTIVAFKLITGLSFESQERILTVLLAPVFFFGFYLFLKRAFGNPVGFLSSLFFLAVPRTYNYLVNVNGEYIAWLILFPALISFFSYVKSRERRFLILSCLLSSVMVISNLMVFVEYALIIGSYLLARTLVIRDTRTMFVQTFFFLSLFLLLVPVPVLYTSGNLVPGSSSTIGSLYSSRSASEAQYEATYYQKYDWYWQLFVHQLPFQVQTYYVSNDGHFETALIMLLGPFAAFGVLSSVLDRRRTNSLFALIWFAAAIISSSLLLSPLFNVTVVAGSIRLLLYFAWPLSVMAGIGLVFLWRNIRNRWKPIAVGVFLAVLIFQGIQMGSMSAYEANEYPQIYAQQYKDALGWLGTHTPTNAVILMNDWTIGEVWMKSNRLSITESGRGSAAYSTYQDIVTTLNDASTILTSENSSLTVHLMSKYSVEWILVWNRPSASYVVDPNKVDFAKFESPPFTSVFNESERYPAPDNSPFHSSYTAWAVIYELANNTLPLSSQAQNLLQSARIPILSQQATSRLSTQTSPPTEGNRWIIVRWNVSTRQGLASHSRSSISFSSTEPESRISRSLVFERKTVGS